MKRTTILAAVLLMALSACTMDMGKDARFGMYGGAPREPKPEPAFDVMSTKWDTRWFPAHVRWAPDDSHLLVSLCHVNRSDYCRIGKYWIAENRWEILHLQPRITYRWPSYSPDGKSIAVSAGGCDENYRCDMRRYVLALLSPDGQRIDKLANSIAVQPSFSNDGKKIIYWRHTGGGAADVAMFDLEHRKEKMLTSLVLSAIHAYGQARFLPGSERFVFSGFIVMAFPGSFLKENGKYVFKNGQAVVDTVLRGTKLDPEVLKNNTTFVADLRSAPIGKHNIQEIDPAGFHLPLDINHKGEMLGWYRCDIECLKVKQAEGAYQPGADGIQPTSPLPDIFHLYVPADPKRTIREFWLPPPIGSASASISNGGRRIAFCEVAGTWHFTNRLGFILPGNRPPQFIDWPRLELDPAATQTLAQ